MDDRIADAAAGMARCPGPSARDIILADGDMPPAALTTQMPRFIGDEDISYKRYTSQEIFDREMQLLWPRVWQWACREEHMPSAGDYVVYDVGPYSVIVVRGEDGEIRAFRNACAHRGTQLRPSETIGSAASLRCPFHGWTFDLKGNLESVPCHWDFPHVNHDSHSLDAVRCETWGGFVFINLDPDAMPLTDYLRPMPEHFKAGWDLSRRTVELHIQKELPNNWKACAEAFLEAYHVLETHSQFMPTTADANAQYDVLGEHVNRFVQPVGFQSPHYAGPPQTQQDLLDGMMFAPPGTQVPEGSTARAVAATEVKKALSARWNLDLSDYSISEMLDSIEYFAFPNAFFFPGVSLPMVYRFRPIGNDPGKTLFDLLIMRPLAEGETPPEPPEPVRIGVAQSYTTVPGINQALGHVYDQDTSILEYQWKGFHASKKSGQTLGNYQEVRIRHLHQLVDHYLAGEGL